MGNTAKPLYYKLNEGGLWGDRSAALAANLRRNLVLLELFDAALLYSNAQFYQVDLANYRQATAGGLYLWWDPVD